jgi:hypothetical protein
MAAVLSTICVTQKTYGKEPDDLKVMVEVFAWALSEYRLDAVVCAIKKYISKNADIPTPSDLIALMPKSRNHIVV